MTKKSGPRIASTPYESNPATLGEFIRKSRVMKNISQAQVAEVLHVTDSYIAHIEKQHRPLAWDTIETLAHFLSVNPTMLARLNLEATAGFKQYRLLINKHFQKAA